MQRPVEEGIVFLQQQLDKLDREIHDHIDRHPDLKEDCSLLQSIPAVGERIGTLMTGLFRAKALDRAEQVAAYLGLTPIERQSGTSVLGRSRLSKAGPAKVRATLFMAAVVAVRHNPDVKALYERLLAKGKSKMSALGASSAKLVQLCFGVWKNRMPYQAGFAQNRAKKA
ncbi:MAG: transposase [Brachymonas sp.]|nr:transposase [Brachymonas sp.]